jgi:chitosanase
MMKFKLIDRLKALAIVNIFETGRAFGSYAAVAVLNDGAGISYGISQFTHRSGALLDVIKRYLETGGTIARNVIERRLGLLRLRTANAIEALSVDDRFKNALRAAAATREMQDAQIEVTFERYMAPAERECERRGFTTPLALAVVYDSMIHGSWERIARRADAARMADESETDWITQYVRERHAWLASIERLRPTTYRTRFFLGQIAVSNWQLRLPLVANGVRLTSETFAGHRLGDEVKPPSAAAAPTPSKGVVKTMAGAMGAAGAKFDQVETAVTGVVRRADAAKSLWTTVGGTIWQAAWGIFGFIAGVPREIWIVVALIAAALMLFYLYRQLALGKIRETASQINN